MEEDRIYRPHEVQVNQKIERGAIKGILTFFIGNGASRLYGLPSWEKFAEKILDKLLSKDKIKYLECDLLKNRPLKEKISIGHKIFKESNFLYRDVLLPESGWDKTRSDIYESLKKCGNRFITTNYDLLFDEILKTPTKEMVHIGNDSDTISVSEEDSEKYRIFHSIDELRGPPSLIDNNLLVHLHGSIEKDKESKMVVSTSEYLNLYGNEKHKGILKLFFRGKIVVIVGYRFDELEVLDLVLRSVNTDTTEKRLENNIFLLLPLFSYQKSLVSHLREYYDSFRVNIIPYCIDDGRNSLEIIMRNWAKKLSEIKTDSSFSENKKIIDNILSKMNDSTKANELLRSIENDERLAIYAYSKIKDDDERLTIYEYSKIKGIDFFIYLNSEKAFSPDTIKKPEKKEDGINYPYWPPLYYLSYVASAIYNDPRCVRDSFVREFLDVLKNILESDNINHPSLHISVAYDTISCITKIPLRFVDEYTIDLVFKTLNKLLKNKTDFNSSLIIKNSIKEMLHNIEETKEDEKKIQRYIKKSFTIVREDVESDFERNDRLKFFSEEDGIGNHHLFYIEKEIIHGKFRKDKKVFILNAVIKVFENLLRESISLNKSLDESSRIWKPKIEIQERTELFGDSPYSIYVHFIYEASLAIIKEGNIPQNVKKWITSPETIFRRISILLSARLEKFQEDKCAKMIIDEGVEKWEKYRYECFHFLKEKFKVLSEKLQGSILDQIESIQVNDSEQKDIIEANKKNGWLQALKGIDNKRIKDMYKETISVIKEDTQLTDSDYIIESWIGERYPWNLEDLSRRSYEGILSVLQTFRNPSSCVEGRTEKGLSEVFEKYILYDTSSVHFFVEKIKEIPTKYLFSLISAFRTLWEKKTSCPYEKLFLSVNSLLDDKEKKKEMVEKRKDSFHDIHSLFWFIQDGTRNDEYAFNKSQNSQCYEIIRKLSEVIRPREGHDFVDRDMYTRSINEPRGVLFKTAIMLSLRQARVDQSTEKAWMMLKKLIEGPLKRQDINEVSLHSLMGYFYRHLMYLNKKWLFSNLATIAPIQNKKKESLWMAFMDGFSYVPEYNREMYKILYDQGILLSYMRYESNGVRKRRPDYRLKSQIVGLAVIAYFLDDESLEGGIIKEIFDKEDPVEWHLLINSIVHIKFCTQKKLEKTKAILIELIKSFNDSSSEVGKEHLKCIDQILTLDYPPTENIIKDIIEIISSFKKIDFFVPDYLKKYKDSYPEEIGDFTIKIFETCDIFFVFPLEDIISICKTLKNNKSTKAEKIFMICQDKIPFDPNFKKLELLFSKG